VFVTESCDDDAPHLITHVETTGASLSDVHQTEVAHQALEKKHLLPKVHLIDTGFIDAELIVKSQQAFDIDLIGPVRQATSWQHQMPEAYDLSKFQIDWERKKVTCPQGKESTTWNLAVDQWAILPPAFNFVTAIVLLARSVNSAPKRRLNLDT
jgi:transposase